MLHAILILLTITAGHDSDISETWIWPLDRDWEYAGHYTVGSTLWEKRTLIDFQDDSGMWNTGYINIYVEYSDIHESPSYIRCYEVTEDWDNGVIWNTQPDVGIVTDSVRYDGWGWYCFEVNPGGYGWEFRVENSQGGEVESMVRFTSLNADSNKPWLEIPTNGISSGIESESLGAIKATFR
jgi:hypothetical protein